MHDRLETITSLTCRNFPHLPPADEPQVVATACGPEAGATHGLEVLIRSGDGDMRGMLSLLGSGALVIFMVLVLFFLRVRERRGR